MKAAQSLRPFPHPERPLSFQSVEYAVDYLLQFFSYDHLPPHLAEVSAPFHDIAQMIVTTLPQNPERTVALRKLLEAKDCAVRAKLFKAA